MEATKPKKQMTWRRGFFRVWVVLASLWVILAIFIGSGSIMSPYVPDKIVATPTGGTVELFDRYGAQQREFENGIAAGALLAHSIQDNFLLYTRADIEPARLEEKMAEARGVVEDYLRVETASRRTAAIGSVLGWTLLPPIIVLLLGSAVAWALMGFRKA